LARFSREIMEEQLKMKHRFIKYGFLLAAIVIIHQSAVAQVGTKKKFSHKPGTGPSDSVLYSGNNTNLNDSTKLLILHDYTNSKFGNKRDQKRYDRLYFIVKKVYPLAKLAGKRMEEYAAAADTLKRGQVKDLVAQIEEEVKTRFSMDLRRLTFKEGIVLLKLLDRQTSKTGYAIIKELKNGFSAMIFQSLASLFDYDLKDEFSPDTVQEDQWINEICLLLDKEK
jgi:hypothetical protein